MNSGMVSKTDECDIGNTVQKSTPAESAHGTSFLDVLVLKEIQGRKRPEPVEKEIRQLQAERRLNQKREAAFRAEQEAKRRKRAIYRKALEESSINRKLQEQERDYRHYESNLAECIRRVGQHYTV